MGLAVAYKSLTVEKEKKSFLKGYHLNLDDVHLFLNVEIAEFDFETEAHNIAENMLEILQKHLTESGEQAIYDRLEESLKEVNFFLNDLKSKKESGNIGKINVIIGVLQDKTLHITKTGLAEAYLLRKGNIIEISEGLYNQKGNEQNYFMNIASGDLELGDKILFVSKRLLKFIGKSDLTSIFVTSAIEDSFTELKHALNVEDIGDIVVTGFVAEEGMQDAAVMSEKKEPATASSSSKQPLSLQKSKEALTGALKKMPGMAKGMVADMQDPAKRKNYIIAGVVLVVLILLLNITSVSNNKTSDEKLVKYKQTLQLATDRLTDARQQKLYDSNLAKASLKEAKKQAIEVRESGVYYKDANDLIQVIEAEEEQMDKITRVDNPTLVVDLSKKDGAVSGVKLVNYRQAFYVLTNDSVLGPIVDSAPDSYTKNTIENGEFLVSADKFPDRDDIVILTKTNKVIEFKENAFTFMDTEDTTWKPGVEVKTYAGRQYIYILDPGNNTIWKYERTSTKYRGGSSYNTDNADIKDAISMAIDGNVYVLKKNGEVKKFYAQKQANFTVEGGPSIPLANLDPQAKIYTNENLRNIYILDPGNERVLVYKKISFENPEKMSYDRQYVFKGQNLRDFYIDDTEQNLFLLTAQKILKVDIKGIQ